MSARNAVKPESRTTPAQDEEKNQCMNVKCLQKERNTSLTGPVFTTSGKNYKANCLQSFRLSSNKSNIVWIETSGIVNTVFFTMLLIYLDCINDAKFLCTLSGHFHYGFRLFRPFLPTLWQTAGSNYKIKWDL